MILLLINPPFILSILNIKSLISIKLFIDKDWLEKHYPNEPSEITADNIHRFLSEIQNRPLKKRGRKRKIEEAAQENHHEIPSNYRCFITANLLRH